MKALHVTAFVLVIIGALNWLLVAFNFNLVEAIFGTSVITTIIYILVGLSALYLIFTHKKSCKHCEASAPSQTM